MDEDVDEDENGWLVGWLGEGRGGERDDIRASIVTSTPSLRSIAAWFCAPEGWLLFWGGG